jgi:ParB family chromosome partitioning protein
VLSSVVNAEWEGVLPSKNVDLRFAKPSKWADRQDKSFEGQEFFELREKIESDGGNDQAIKVRPIPGTAPHEFEIVFGHRRHRSCHH